jgi:hypothetical protein
MDVLVELPLTLSETIGIEEEVRQNLIDLLFRDLLQFKQMQLLETLATSGVSSTEQQIELRKHLEMEISVVKQAIGSAKISFPRLES